MNKKNFKYNMTLYYQLLVVYFVSFVIYVLLRLQFSGFDFQKIKNDSIFYLFIILIGYVLISTFYYLIKKKEIIIDENKIVLKSNFKTIEIPFEKIISVKVSREHKFHLSGFLRTIKIRFQDDRRKVVSIRPFDYENDEELFSELIRLRDKTHKPTEVKNA